MTSCSGARADGFREVLGPVQPVALLCSEAIRPTMAGIGIRYLEMAKRLPSSGVPVRLLSPFTSEEERQWVQQQLPNVAVTTYDGGALGPAVSGCRAIVAQGQFANEVIHQGVDLPLVVDLYDPWLIENLHYVDTLGLDPYRNDHATWMLQLSAGDMFLCSSQEQQLFYSGLLVATGRVNPVAMQEDPALDRLLRIVPFGIPEHVAEHQPVLGDRGEGERRILFGGLYDWYDPWPLLEGFRTVVLSGESAWRLFIVHNPNSGTPQELVKKVKVWIAQHGLEDNVKFLDWQPAERRYDLLRDVDVLAATHRDSLETRLSLRTRFLDALAVGCPILVTEGGTLSRRLVEHSAGWVVPEGDAYAIASALTEILGEDTESSLRSRRERVQGALSLKEDFSWQRVLAPLVEYLQDPWRDVTKGEFAASLPTLAPEDSLRFRLQRKLRRWAGGVW